MSRYALRKANRQGTEACSICGQVCRLVEHHIQGRSVPNCNAKSNIAWICPTCHDKVHSGDIQIQGWAMSTEGHILLFNTVKA
jgi:hypothetical protein